MKTFPIFALASALILTVIALPLAAQPLQPVDISVTPPPAFYTIRPDQYAMQAADTIGSRMLIVWGQTRAISDSAVVGELYYQFAERDSLVGIPNRLTSIDARPSTKVQVFHTDDLFLVTWLDERYIGYGGGLYLQRFNTEGFPVGDRLNLTDSVDGRPSTSSVLGVVGSRQQGLLVLWQQANDVWGLHIDPDGDAEFPAEHITTGPIHLEPIVGSGITGIVQGNGQMLLVGADGRRISHPPTLSLTDPHYLDSSLVYARIVDRKLEVYASIFDSIPIRVVPLPMLDSSLHKQGLLSRDSTGQFEVSFLTARVTGQECFSYGKLTNTIYRVSEEDIQSGRAPRIVYFDDTRYNGALGLQYICLSEPKPLIAYGSYNTGSLGIEYRAEHYQQCNLLAVWNTTLFYSIDTFGVIKETFGGAGNLSPSAVHQYPVSRTSDSLISRINVQGKVRPISIRVDNSRIRQRLSVIMPGIMIGKNEDYMLFDYVSTAVSLPLQFCQLAESGLDSSTILQSLSYGPVSSKFVNEPPSINPVATTIQNIYHSRHAYTLSGRPLIATTQYDINSVKFHDQSGHTNYGRFPNTAFHIYTYDSGSLRTICQRSTPLKPGNFEDMICQLGHVFGTIPRRNEIVFGIFWSNWRSEETVYGSRLDSIIAIHPDGSYTWRIPGYFAPDATYLPIDSARYMVVRADSTLIMFGTSVDRVIHYPKATRGFRAFSREDGALLRTYADASGQDLLHVELYAPNGDVIVTREFTVPDSALTKGNYTLVQRDSDHSFIFLWGTQNDGIHGMMLDHTLSIVVRDTLISNWRGKAINPSGIMQGDTLRVVWEDYRGTMSDIYTNSMVMPQTSTLSVEESKEPGREEEIGAVIHPNPATEYLQIDLRQFPNEGSIRLELYNARGAVVETMEAEPGSRPTIATGTLPAGFYRVTWEQGRRTGSVACSIVR